MASLATWLTLTTILSAGLAGCVQPYPEDEPPVGKGCFTVVDSCCDDCCYDRCTSPPRPGPTPPTPTPWVCPVYEERPAHASRFDEPCRTPPLPPLLEPIEPRLLLDDCADCGAVSLATDGRRLFAATRTALVVAEGDLVRSIRLRELPARASHVAADATGAWIVALHDDGALAGLTPALLLARYDGGDDLASVATLDVVEAPPLALARRAYVAPTADGAIVVLDAGDAAWAIWYSSGAFHAPERLTPVGGEALVGAPATDASGSILVPFAFRPKDPITTVAPLLTPSAATTSLHVATLGRAGGAWSSFGGMVVPRGVASPPSLAMAHDGRGAFTWIDDAGRIMRVEMWDDGGSWGAPSSWAPWSAAVGAPASALDGLRPTIAWWQEAGTLVVTRSEGEPRASAVQTATESGLSGDAALALVGGRAVVAWLSDQGELWAGIEGGALPMSGECDAISHCAPGRMMW